MKVKWQLDCFISPGELVQVMPQLPELFTAYDEDKDTSSCPVMS